MRTASLPVISVVWHDTPLAFFMYLLFKFIPHEHGLPLFLSCFLSLSLFLWISLCGIPSCPCLSVGSKAAFMQTDRMQTTILKSHMYNCISSLKNHLGKIAVTSITDVFENYFLQYVIFHHYYIVIYFYEHFFLYTSVFFRINIEKKESVSCPLSTMTCDQKKSSKRVRPASLPVRCVT